MSVSAVSILETLLHQLEWLHRMTGYQIPLVKALIAREQMNFDALRTESANAAGEPPTERDTTQPSENGEDESPAEGEPCPTCGQRLRLTAEQIRERQRERQRRYRERQKQ